MQLVQQSDYLGVPIDFYLDKKREIYVTIEQLAQGFGYKSRKGIERMLDRYGYLREKQFSIIDKVHHRLGGTQETRLFNKRGIFEIGMLSRTEKGRAFRQWLYDYLEALEKENHQFKLQRALEKPLRVTLTDAIKQWEYAKPYSYKHFTDLLLKATTGRNAKQLKQERGTEDSISLDLLSADELTTYQQYETMLIGMVLLGYQYEVIKNTVLGEK